MNNMLAAAGGMVMILFCAVIVVGALIFQKVYIDDVDENAISVNMKPFASSALVRNSDVGLQIRLRSTDDWSVVFDINTVPVNMGDTKNGHLSVISDAVGDSFVAKNVHDSNEHSNYLVLDDQYNVWHYYFNGHSLTDRSFVTKFVTHNTSWHAGAIDLVD